MIDSEELLRASFENMIRGVYTAIPGVVVEVTEASLKEQRVDVQPLVNILGVDGSSKARPTIYSVPVIFPASKRSAFTFPVEEGDTVLCVFSMRGTETFKAGEGRPQPPSDLSCYSGKDAFVIPGLFPFKLAVNNPSKRTLSHSTKDTVIAHNIGTGSECEIRLKPDGGVTISSPGNVEVKCKTAEVVAEESVKVATNSLNIEASGASWTGQVDLSGDFNLTGTLRVNGVDVNKHTHANSAGTTTPMIP